MSFANVSFKIIYNGEIRRFTKPRPSFDQFNAIIKSLLGTSYPLLRVCYRDEEGDVISVSSELEWDSALEYLSKDRLVRFVLYDRSVNPTASIFQKAELGAQSVLSSQLDSKRENMTKEEAEERRNKFLKSLEDCRPKNIQPDIVRKQSKEEEERKKAGEEIKKILAEEFEREKKVEERIKEEEQAKKVKEEEEQAKKEKEKEEQAKKEAEKKAEEEAELQKAREEELLQKQREQEAKEAEEQRKIRLFEEERRRKQEAEEEERKAQEELVKKTLEEEEEKLRQLAAEENKKKASLLQALTEEWETFTDKHFEAGENKQAEKETEKKEERKPEEQEKIALLNQYQKELVCLREMGFFEQERNLALLKKHSGSVALALDELVSS
eukprot:TRINITY_DN2076_c0_g1_i1.p1 TRINITY_DN2076_c0_g1~~TRINITY_DN2076_c0_g1_i1.p1  ORF type:complete len:383 (-),score=132.96 TRINITY_DN2076_c0_g1_i1:154-1302(-)